MNKIHTKQKIKSILSFISSKFNLFTGLTLVIVVALLIVGLGYSLYWNDENRKYDIARAGDQENEALGVVDPAADTTGPVDKNAIKQKIKFLDKEIKALESLNEFNPTDLSNESIQLVQSERPEL